MTRAPATGDPAGPDDPAGGPAPGDAAVLRTWLAESDFPADTDTVLALLVRRGSPAHVLRWLAALPWSQTFADLDECQRYVRRLRPPPRSWSSPTRESTP